MQGVGARFVLDGSCRSQKQAAIDTDLRASWLVNERPHRSRRTIRETDFATQWTGTSRDLIIGRVTLSTGTWSACCNVA